MSPVVKRGRVHIFRCRPRIPNPSGLRAGRNNGLPLENRHKSESKAEDGSPLVDELDSLPFLIVFQVIRE